MQAVIIAIIGLTSISWRVEVGKAVGEYSRWTLVQAGVSVVFAGQQLRADCGRKVSFVSNTVLGINFPVVLTEGNSTSFLNGDVHLHREFLWLVRIRGDQRGLIGFGLGPYLRILNEDLGQKGRWTSFRPGFPSFRITVGMVFNSFRISLFWYRTVSGKPNFIGISLMARHGEI